MPDMPEAVTMVEGMVREYVKEDCIILVTVPMSGASPGLSLLSGCIGSNTA
jgi:hypothetical protein